MIALFLLADLFFLVVVVKKRISIKDVFVYVFFGFVNLYTLCNFVASITGLYARYPVKELTNPLIIKQMLFASSLSIFTFAYCLFRTRRLSETGEYIPIRNVHWIELFYVIFYPLAFYLNTIDNWTSGERIGIVSQFSAYSRNILTVLCAVLFTSKKISKKRKLIFLALYLLITYRSTQRANMFIVLVAFAYNITNVRNVLYALVLGIVALLGLGSIRNGVSFFNFAYPIFAEGIFGSWGLLQAIDVINTDGYDISYFFRLFGSTFNWLFGHLGINTSFATLENIIKAAGKSYYPMGGFFYLSDAYLMHPVIGSIVYTILIFLLYRWALKGWYGSHSPMYLICLSMLFSCVKGAMWVFVAYLLFHLLFYAALKIGTNLDKWRYIKIRRLNFGKLKFRKPCMRYLGSIYK